MDGQAYFQRSVIGKIYIYPRLSGSFTLGIVIFLEAFLAYRNILAKLSTNQDLILPPSVNPKKTLLGWDVRWGNIINLTNVVDPKSWLPIYITFFFLCTWWFLFQICTISAWWITAVSTQSLKMMYSYMLQTAWPWSWILGTTTPCWNF